jgi:hypothetical protein
LQLKEILKTHPGRTRVELEFYSGQNKIGHIEADSVLSVNYKDEIKNKILSLSGINGIAIS